MRAGIRAKGNSYGPFLVFWIDPLGTYSAQSALTCSRSSIDLSSISTKNCLLVPLLRPLSVSQFLGSMLSTDKPLLCIVMEVTFEG